MKELSSGELIALIQEGNQRAAQELVERYAKPLFGYIFRRIDNHETAEDIFQNTFVSVFKNLRRYREEGNFKAWLFRIAHNQVLDYLKKRRVNAEGNQTEKVIADNSSDALEKIIAAEQKTRMFELIEQLPEKQKAVLLMRLESGLTFKEIAKTLKCPVNTVIARMHYALKKIKKGMKNNER